jgi:hypothetical protein
MHINPRFQYSAIAVQQTGAEGMTDVTVNVASSEWHPVFWRNSHDSRNYLNHRLNEAAGAADAARAILRTSWATKTS